MTNIAKANAVLLSYAGRSQNPVVHGVMTKLYDDWVVSGSEERSLRELIIERAPAVVAAPALYYLQGDTKRATESLECIRALAAVGFHVDADVGGFIASLVHKSTSARAKPSDPVNPSPPAPHF